MVAGCGWARMPYLAAPVLRTSLACCGAGETPGHDLTGGTSGVGYGPSSTAAKKPSLEMHTSMRQIPHAWSPEDPIPVCLVASEGQRG